MGAMGTIYVKAVEKSRYQAPPQGGPVVAVILNIRQVPYEGQNLGLTRTRVGRADFDRNESPECLVSREPDSGIAAVAKLIQDTVMTPEQVADGHWTVSARAIPVKGFCVFDDMEADAWF
ncbi:uncharacterized protein E0L32_008298 [Thyridium curvatum]|uniref:Uncharacterized protein n=1 Tax=Thyridium curvatum TaxID=1093900 RepID=A0A507B0C5_9PEZI|nr:uncharacterized protein E0L32_008298 [Thyridium curvatum]TPX10729.1 hypothetical protein E0L32_008298 [Thyridium curvatum]